MAKNGPIQIQINWSKFERIVTCLFSRIAVRTAEEDAAAAAATRVAIRITDSAGQAA